MQTQTVFALLSQSNPLILLLAYATLSTGMFSPGLADEGMFPISELGKLDLKAKGIELTAEELFNPKGLSLVDGVCRVNGCTGSFVSKSGLIITNHHCAYDAIQKASTPKKGASSLINTAEANSSNSPPILFLSGNPDEARSLGQQLRFLDGGLSTVFATSEIYSGTLDPRKDHALNGLLFCDMPWVLRSDQEMPLRLTLQSAPGYKPGLVRLQALGLDAFNLIPYLDRLKQNPNESYPGVTGNLNLGENNRIHRKLLWAKFEGGVPRLLENGANP